MNDAGLSLSALAKVLRRAKSGLHKLAKTGKIPQLPNGRYDLAAVQRALDGNLEPSRAKRSQGEQNSVDPGEQVNSSALRSKKEAKQAVTMIQEVLETEGAYHGKIDFNAARTAELILKARARYIEIEHQAKRLVDANVVKESAFGFAREYRDALMNWPSQIGAMLAHEIGSDPVVTMIALEKYVRQHLTEISTAAEVRAKVEEAIERD
ncbi:MULTISPECIES: hypothetical protein [unclassified Bradyrhizobium]|uniref:hypothetical protein n=1 Tax=Bradyrhizobium sp. USDA 4541 TaxID=2817704 RepID=UPI0020A2DD9E|nr:hypothetical protein [Bradyrhizobium sp. USDA 4541]MCP1851231.1 hypothetical protein [Bradyrhizobium sp. USDA 4541]